MKKNKTAGEKRDIRTFEADEDVAAMMDRAIANGQQLKQLVNEALREQGPKVLKLAAERLRARADALENIHGGKR